MEFTECRLNHNFISKFFSLVFNSDRDACVARIKEIGEEAFAAEMSELGSQTIKHKK